MAPSSRPDDPTIAATADPTIAQGAGPPTPGSGRASGSAPGSTPFPPGSILAGRYRLIALLGRGGMGEVYRADDLTLGQPVALKFLTEGVTADASHLAQFHNELRTARQVSHKNVCRLYDLGEADGRRFLTMEYVDGEDLSSLLRRIGRLAPDKGIEIARQLCAGLAAAHERGVIHRDLKPANIMLDGEGHVRVTDFGLAMTAGDTQAMRAGTPHYMAPELLSGEPASIKSDIYALGLVLFEIFTGRRAHDAKSFEELKRWHETGTLKSLTAIVGDIDPAIERVIQRCLARDPAARPASVLGIAAALPGGDPLAAALAAGETPSPDLVAAAGRADALPTAVGLSLVTAAVALVVGLGLLLDHTLLVSIVPINRSLDALEGRAQDVVSALGYADRPMDSARGVAGNSDYVQYVSRTDRGKDRWNDLKSGVMPGLLFWYRTSPRDLVPVGLVAEPTWTDPPLTVPNMTALTLDTEGRLLDFAAVPPQVAEPSSTAPVDWKRLFDLAGLSIDRFKPVEPRWSPRSFADGRVAWEGTRPEKPDVSIRVEGAAYQGRPVSFVIVGPWTRPVQPQQTPLSLSRRLAGGIGAVVLALLIFAGVALARHNLRLGRGDQSGAIRVSVFVTAIELFAWAVGAKHTFDLGREFNTFMSFAALAVFSGVLMGLMYVALEPYVRRYSPELLFSWTRLLRGQFRDARVGRDVLVGIVAGLCMSLAMLSGQLMGAILSSLPPMLRGINYVYLYGSRAVVSTLAQTASNAISNAVILTLIFVAARAITGRIWAARVIFIVVLTVLIAREAGSDSLWAVLCTASVFAVIALAALQYSGVLAVGVAAFVQLVVTQAPLTVDPSKMYSPVGMWVILIICAGAASAFYSSRGGEPLFGGARV